MNYSSDNTGMVYFPTKPEHVKLALRHLGEPWILFGEEHIERVERLRSLILRQNKRGIKIEFPFLKKQDDTLPEVLFIFFFLYFSSCLLIF
jgi:hypothetical protein